MTYRILRFFSPGAEEGRSTRTIKTGLSLDEAKAHCSNPATEGGIYCARCGLWSERRKAHPASCGGETANAWFDGYTKE